MEKFSWPEIGIIIGGVGGFTSGLFGIIIYFTKKWMNNVEGQHKVSIASVAQVARDTAASVAQVARDTAASVAQVSRENRDENVRLTSEIKEGIKSNRDEYMRTGAEIKCSIDKLSDHVAKTNGRISDQELKIAVQIETCKQIQEGKRLKKEKISCLSSTL
jgi:hypothetical protein